MKKVLPFLLLALGLFIAFRGLKSTSDESGLDWQGFAELPAQSGGRILPLDAYARNTLKIISSREKVYTPEGDKLPAIRWLAELAFRPEIADTWSVIRIESPDVLDALGMKPKIRAADSGFMQFMIATGMIPAKNLRFSFEELQPRLPFISEEASKVNTDANKRSPYEKQLLRLYNTLILYTQASHALSVRSNLDDISTEYRAWPEAVGPGREAFSLRERGETYDEHAFNRFAFLTDRYMRLSRFADLGIAPPLEQQGEDDDWLNFGETLLQTIRSGELSPIVDGYGELTVAYRKRDAGAFNDGVAKLNNLLGENASSDKVEFEAFFYKLDPFYSAFLIYFVIFIVVCLSWLRDSESLQAGASWLLLLALVIHTFGLLARMYIQDRPPVTNLYSSAIFVGWGAVALGYLLERIFRNGLGSFVSAFIGFVSLIIAQNLSKTGDTLEMMRAVLDSNFWLATHVVIITIGYSVVFLAGTFGLVYVLKGMLTPSLDKASAQGLYRMTYGVTCFGLLFSFVGTMLGGIWADQSWGRFWGWDPKENGALLIVLWGALMLHARWGKVVQERGFMLLAIGGNIITAWSWFGTNMLGIGLHSYGFMDKAFFWLATFWASQVLVILLGLLPQRYWRSSINE